MASQHELVISPIALLTALALADEHGGARAAIRATGLYSDPLEGMEGVRPHLARTLDVSSFLMDHDLVVRGAEGRSILRLPWFAPDLFVARQLPDITEMPENVRVMAVANYRAGLGGERRRFEFTSYGLRYTVESVPVRGEDGRVQAVLGMARPATTSADGDAVSLTAREREMLQLAADGLSGPQIAARLVLSPGTVKTHFQNIYKKWGVSDRAGAVARALRQGLID